MELHFVTLRRLAAELNDSLAGGKIVASYSQQKNEQIIRVESASGAVKELLLSAEGRYPCLLLKHPGKRGRRSADVVEELLDQKIESIHLLGNERVTVFEFQGNNIRYLARLFRNQTNFFLVDADEQIVNSFKKSKKHSGRKFSLQPRHLTDPLQMTREQFSGLLKSDPEAPVDYLLKRHFLYMTPLLAGELEQRVSFSLKHSAGDLTAVQAGELQMKIRELIHSAAQDRPRIYYEDGFPAVFSLTELKLFTAMEVRFFDDVNDALSAYIFQRRKQEQYRQKREKVENALKKKLNQVRQIIGQLHRMPDEEAQRSRYRKMGELLLAQMYTLPEGRRTVEVVDYYDSEQKKIRINLNPNLSLQENAENYFNRAKETDTRRRELEARLQALQRQLTELELLETRMTQNRDWKALVKIEKRLQELHILQTDTDKLEEVYRPYKQYFFQNWEIWVGKNARANDQMTFRTAHKEDFWLHAQGAGGSHVIIRNPNRQHQPPRAVLEYAGRLAASNSQAKHSSYVPVMYTRVKYVRKPRGSAPGAVLPERTQTVFVEPLRQN